MIRSLAIASLTGLLATASLAETPTDRLFAPGGLEQVAAGTTLEFAQSRDVPEGAALEPLAEGNMSIAIGNAETAAVSFDLPERRVTLPPHPRAAAHPALLVFLEMTNGSVATLSGGSPHYIKNRFIESFQAAPAITDVEVDYAGGTAAERIVYRPFQNDPNAGRMGALAALELAFVLSDTVPGGLYSATASAGAYSESLTMEDGE